ncbi:MAG: amino acid racemase [Bacteroidales bacterium]
MKRIGILGGMGPEATLALYELIVKNTPARSDQEHIPTIINSNTATPDRTKHIVYGQESPLPYLIEGAQLLQRAGADMILIACNTAHYYIPQITPHIEIPILHMLDLTASFIAEEAKKGGVEKPSVGVLATTGTIRSQLYKNSLEKFSLNVLIPTSTEQEELVMEGIYGKEGVKAGFHRQPAKLLQKAAHLLEERGANFIIAGCTEIPLVLTESMVGVKLVNSMEVLAKEAIKLALEAL